CPALVRTSRFRDFVLTLNRNDARLRRRAGAGGANASTIPAASVNDFAGRRALAVGPERRLPRRAVHAAVPRADLDVRVAGGVSVQARAATLAMGLRSEPNGRRNRRVSLGVARHR